jgi:two-component system copper resistance phosphate regulon response regulator CusR
MRILVVEDEPRLNAHLVKGLEQHGYSVDGVEHGSEALELAATEKYDLIVLDVMLPGQNGFQILENLRAFKLDIPVMIISALSATHYVVEGLDKGAVDYLKKPFEFDEFLARVRAVTRKGAGRHYTRYKLQAIEMDLLARKVHTPDGEVPLTRREFSLLELLLSQCNRVISKSEIAEKVWNINFGSGSNVIEVHLSQLRKKLGPYDIVQTRIGSGYVVEGEIIRS